MADKKAILKMANAAISDSDHEGFLSFCTDDLKWTMVGDKTLDGKDAVRQWMATAYKEPPTFSIATLIAEGDYLTALGDISLKDPSGTSTHYSYCDVWRFRDGKMAELQAFVIQTDET